MVVEPGDLPADEGDGDPAGFRELVEERLELELRSELGGPVGEELLELLLFHAVPRRDTKPLAKSEQSGESGEPSERPAFKGKFRRKGFKKKRKPTPGRKR